MVIAQPVIITSSKCIDYIEKLPFMVIFLYLYSNYILVCQQAFSSVISKTM